MIQYMREGLHIVSICGAGFTYCFSMWGRLHILIRQRVLSLAISNTRIAEGECLLQPQKKAPRSQRARMRQYIPSLVSHERRVAELVYIMLQAWPSIQLGWTTRRSRAGSGRKGAGSTFDSHRPTSGSWAMIIVVVVVVGGVVVVIIIIISIIVIVFVMSPPSSSSSSSSSSLQRQRPSISPLS